MDVLSGVPEKCKYTVCQGPSIVIDSLALPDPRRQPVIAYSMNARRERVWDTTIPCLVLAPPELGWAMCASPTSKLLISQLSPTLVPVGPEQNAVR